MTVVYIWFSLKFWTCILAVYSFKTETTHFRTNSALVKAGEIWVGGSHLWSTPETAQSNISKVTTVEHCIIDNAVPIQ